MKYKIQLPVILFIIAAVYFVPIINLGVGPYDEGVILVGADRIVHGEIPYKDFSTAYPPGQAYTLAALFKLFGTSVLTGRIYDIVIRSFLALIIFIIVRLLTSNKIALVGWAMALVWLGHSSYPVYPVYPTLLFTWLSVYFLLLHMMQQKMSYVVFSALSIVVAVLFRHDIGGYAVIVMISFLLVRRLMGMQRSWTPLISFVGSGIMAVLPLLIYFYMNSAIEFMVNDIILMPFRVLTLYAELPYPSLSRWNLPFFVFPLILLIGGVTSLILIKRRPDNLRAHGVLLISFIGIFSFNQVRVRSDIIHLLPVAMYGILLAPILFYAISKELSFNTWQNKLVCVLFIIVFSITLSKPASKVIQSFPKGYVVAAVNPDIKRARYTFVAPDIKKAVTYIRNNTSKNEYIYVGVKNHDRFRFNDAAIYFLADRNCATKYHELDSGVTTTLKVQEEMVSDLVKKSVKIVVLALRTSSELNLSSIDLKLDLLDDYILTNYDLKKTYGIYEIWSRKL